MKSYSRSRVFEILGAVPTNPRWSWCAMHANRHFAVFTLWADLIDGNRTRLSSVDPVILKLNGSRDQERVIDEVLQLGIPAYGLICYARDVDASPRSIERVNAEYLVCLNIMRINGVAYADHKGKKYILDFAASARGNAIEDLSDSASVGSETPDRASHFGFAIKRNAKVRRLVIARANGHCEYCGKEGFLTASGSRFVEAHHIISLAEQGPDRPGNVIGLCPEHHRQAHFGIDAATLESEFTEILKRKTGR